MIYSSNINIFNLLYFNFLDHFESACISYFYFYFNSFYVFILSSSLFYMFQTLLILLLVRIHYLFDLYVSNLLLLVINIFINFINDIVSNYILYIYNIFFLFISFIFLWIFINNILGLLPFSNTINNHLNITGLISFVFWLGSVFIGFKCFSTYFISIFVVNGIPRALIPFLGGIEMLSYFFRFISLSLRLFSNIVSGHILLETVYIFLFKNVLSDNKNKILVFFLLLIPSLLFILLILFESVISFLQAYIFIVLCLIYLKESLYFH